MIYENSFPECKVEGSQEPVPYQHGMLTGHIPEKCSTCHFLQGGLCARAAQLTGELLNLDHGPCSKSGNTDPTTINVPGVYPYQQTEVPYKCSSCAYLKGDGSGTTYCMDQTDIWNGFPRGVDWGKWKPDHPVVGVAGHRLDRNILLLEYRGRRSQAIQAFKKLNPKVRRNDAMKVMEEVRRRLLRADAQEDPGGPYW